MSESFVPAPSPGPSLEKGSPAAPPGSQQGVRGNAQTWEVLKEAFSALLYGGMVIWDPDELAVKKKKKKKENSKRRQKPQTRTQKTQTYRNKQANKQTPPNQK